MTIDDEIIVAYQGEPGCYSEEAAHRFFGDDVECLPSKSFGDLFKALNSGRATRAMLPIENMLAGTLHQNLDRVIGSRRVNIVGEVEVRVKHCLLARTADADVKVVRSHEMALLQCPTFIESRGMRAEIAADTAGAARELSDASDEEAAHIGAIASERAAARYGLHVLARNIGDAPVNVTRFWVLSLTPAAAPSPQVSHPNGVRVKTSIAFTLENGPGKLVQALSAFAYHDIDLSNIESRQIHSLGSQFDHPAHKLARWQYIFYVDLVGTIEERTISMAIESLKTKTAFFRLLGSYEVYGIETAAKSKFDAAVTASSVIPDIVLANAKV